MITHFTVDSLLCVALHFLVNGFKENSEKEDEFIQDFYNL